MECKWEEEGINNNSLHSRLIPSFWHVHWQLKSCGAKKVEEAAFMRMQLRDPYEPEVSEERCCRCDEWELLGDGLCVTCYDKSAEKADKYQIKEGRDNEK